MRRRRFAFFLIAGSLLAAPGREAAACPIPVESLWETLDRAAWVGVLQVRCASVPIPEELRAAWTSPEDEETTAPPDSFIRIVEWKPIRTIAGEEGNLPSAAEAGWGCEAEGWQEPAIVAFETDGGAVLTPFAMSPPPAESLDAHVDWVRDAVKIQRARGDRRAEQRRVDWVVGGIVDARTRAVAIQELVAAGWWPTDDPDATASPLGAPEKDRLLRGFVREPDVPDTLPRMLWLLRDQPSLVADLAAAEAMDAELARLADESEPLPSWGAPWAMGLVLERLGVADAARRVRIATSDEGRPDARALGDLWREVLCETGYAPRATCEPDPDSAQPDLPQP